MKKQENAHWRLFSGVHGWKSLLFLLGFGSACALEAQPYVTVPVGPNITIVAAGAGTPGAGQIGNGGVVCMVDPDPVGGVFSIAGVTVPVWNLLGDLSVNTASVPPTAPIITLSGLTCGIETYNKSVAAFETVAPEVNSHARSIGQVTVSYMFSGSPGSLTFKVYKKWGNPATTVAGNNYAPPIVGPNCFSTGSINFTVAPVCSQNPGDGIGQDQYYWTLKNGANAPLSNTSYLLLADGSGMILDQTSAAFSTWLAGGVPYTIQCCYGRCNPWDGGLSATQATVGNCCVTKVINPAPVPPTFTTPIPTCLSVSTTSFTAVYVPVAGHTYTWSSTCAWTLTPGIGTLMVSGAGQGSCTLQLTCVGPCGTNVYSYPVKRTFNTTVIPTASTTCVAPGSSFTVSLPAAAQDNCTNWTITPVPFPAWTFVNGNVNGSIRTYTIPAGACAGAYTFTASNCTCPGNSASLIVNVRPNTPVITGPTCVPYSAAGPAQVYTSTAPCGTTGYAWSNTLGMTGSSNTSSISYTPGGTLGGQVSVSALGTNGCNSNQAVRNVNRTPPTPVVIKPCVNVGLPGTATFSVVPVAGMCYTWSFPAGFATPANPTGSSVTVNTLGNTVGSPFNCSVTANNCGAPLCGPVTTNFTMNVAYTTFIAVDNSNPGFSVVVATPGQTSYQLWNCSTNSFQGPAQLGNSFALNIVGSGSFSVNITTPAGCIQRPPCVFTLYHSFEPNPNGNSSDDELSGSRTLSDVENGVSISPNPSTGRFTISLLNEVEHANATLYNASGQQIGETHRLSTGNNTIGDEDLAPGIYTVRIELNGELLTRQIAVARQ
jgi:hypothetical protein